MSDESPPLVYGGLDPIPKPKSAMSEIPKLCRRRAGRVSRTIEAGRRPGMPLSVLSDIVRGAPLASLLTAFLLGVAVARRSNRGL